jgi:uncharacterized coiled-coil DUF342 family protein
MSEKQSAGAAGTQPAAAPSQADVLAENETLKGQVTGLTTRITTAEGQIALLTTQRDAATAQVATMTKQVGELTAQLTSANAELATLRPKAEDAAKQAAAIIASAGITGSKDKAASGAAEKPKTLTERAIAARKAEGLKVPATV